MVKRLSCNIFIDEYDQTCLPNITQGISLYKKWHVNFFIKNGM